jgi:hypothetical protein
VLNYKDPSKAIYNTFGLVGTDVVHGGTLVANVYQGYANILQSVFGNTSMLSRRQIPTSNDLANILNNFRQSHSLTFLAVNTLDNAFSHAVVIDGTDGGYFKLFDPWGSVYNANIDTFSASGAASLDHVVAPRSTRFEYDSGEDSGFIGYFAETYIYETVNIDNLDQASLEGLPKIGDNVPGRIDYGAIDSVNSWLMESRSAYLSRTDIEAFPYVAGGYRDLSNLYDVETRARISNDLLASCSCVKDIYPTVSVNGPDSGLSGTAFAVSNTNGSFFVMSGHQYGMSDNYDPAHQVLVASGPNMGQVVGQDIEHLSPLTALANVYSGFPETLTLSNVYESPDFAVLSQGLSISRSYSVSTSVPKPGTSVILLGYPAYVTSSSATERSLVAIQGTVQGTTNAGELIITPVPGQLPTYGGMSGGPVVLQSNPNEVVGIHVAGTTTTKFATSMVANPLAPTGISININGQ